MPSTAHRVQPGSFLTLHYRLAGPGGDIVNTFKDKPATLTLGTGELSPAVEKHLIGLAEGAHASFDIPAGEAFGDRNAEMVQWISRKLLAEMGKSGQTFEVGDVVQFPTPDGMGTYSGWVVRVGQEQANGKSDSVLFDFNHPLAGKPVTFEVQLIGVL